eukprot:scaffold18267_cov146-Isochrysis_galbana.AAC.7
MPERPASRTKGPRAENNPRIQKSTRSALSFRLPPLRHAHATYNSPEQHIHTYHKLIHTFIRIDGFSTRAGARQCPARPRTPCPRSPSSCPHSLDPPTGTPIRVDSFDLERDVAQRPLRPEAEGADVLQGGGVGAVLWEGGARLDGLAGGVVPKV